MSLRIKIQIPNDFHKEPIISRLSLEHGLTVNIIAALLSNDSQWNGWFDLELEGNAKQVQSGLAYLQELNVKIWGKPNPHGDSW